MCMDKFKNQAMTNMKKLYRQNREFFDLMGGMKVEYGWGIV